MADDATHTPTPLPPRRRGRVVLVLTGAALAALVSLGLFVGWDRLRPPSPPVIDQFPENALDGYLPEGAAAVYALDARQVLAAPVTGKYLQGPLQHLVARAQGGQPWMGLLGADPFAAVERLEIVF